MRCATICCRLCCRWHCRPPTASCFPFGPSGPPQNWPFYRIFAADARSPRDGRHLEQLGHYDPIPGANLLPEAGDGGSRAACTELASCLKILLSAAMSATDNW